MRFCAQCITTVQRDAGAATQEQCARLYVYACVHFIDLLRASSHLFPPLGLKHVQLSVLLLDVDDDDDYDDGGDHHDHDHHHHYCFVHQHVQMSVLLLDVGDDDEESNDDACQSHRLTRKSGMPVTPRRKCSWLYKSSL